MTTEELAQIPRLPEDPVPENDFEAYVFHGKLRMRELGARVAPCCLTRFLMGFIERLQATGYMQADLDELTGGAKEDEYIILLYAIGCTPEDSWAQGTSRLALMN